MTDLFDAGIAEALEHYRETRAIDADSPEWDQLLAWYRKTQRGETLVYCERLDRQLARMRRDAARLRRGQAAQAAYRAVRSISAPKGLTEAQTHQFWSAVFTELEQLIVDARENLGPPPPPPDLAVVRDDDE